MIDQNKWFKLDFAQQLGNIGSEVARARSRYEKNDTELQDKSLWRVLEMIDDTIADPRWRNRLKELTRFREIICCWLSHQDDYEISPQEIENYCLQFSIR